MVINNKSYLTAIVRKKPSLPMRYLHDHGLLYGDVLDYGCGRGFDCDYFNIRGYDPYFRADYPYTKFDTITCNYVLNVVEQKDQEKIIQNIKSLLKQNGIAYFTVRRDNFKEGFNLKGTYQTMVYLDPPFELLKKTNTYAIYKLTKDGDNGKET